MRLRTLFRLFLLLAAVAPITTAKADSLIIGTDTLRLDLHWLDDTPLDELARNDRVFEKKFQALIHQPTAEGFVIYIDGDHEHHSYWRLIDDKLYLDHTIRKSDYSEIDFSGIFRPRPYRLLSGHLLFRHTSYIRHILPGRNETHIRFRGGAIDLYELDISFLSLPLSDAGRSAVSALRLHAIRTIHGRAVDLLDAYPPGSIRKPHYHTALDSSS